MADLFEYKGFKGTIEPDLSTGQLFGKVMFIRDVITYGAETVKMLEKEFQLEIDDYLADCAEIGVEPNKPASGIFQVRTSPDIHRKCQLEALEQDLSLNEVVNQALEYFFDLKENGREVHHHTKEVVPVVIRVPTDSEFSASETFNVEPHYSPLQSSRGGH